MLRSRPLVAALLVMWMVGACAMPQAITPNSTKTAPAKTGVSAKSPESDTEPGVKSQATVQAPPSKSTPRAAAVSPKATTTPPQKGPKTKVSSARPSAQEHKSHPFVLAYFTEDEPSDGLKGSFDVLMAQASRIDAVVPFWFQLSQSGDGSIVRFAGVTQKTIRKVTSAAHDKHVQVYALVHNLLYSAGTTSSEVAELVLNDPERRHKLVAQTVGIIQGYGFDGVNIDFESIGPAAKYGYVAYLRELSAELKPRGLKLTVSIPPKTSGDDHSEWSGGYDYWSIGKYADLVAIMTYQAHGPGTAPGPIAPLGWVGKVMKYASSVIPRDRLLVGVSAYGFDWNDDGNETQYLGYTQAQDRAALSGSKEGYDEDDQAPYIQYMDKDGSKHQVWYEDADSTRAKLTLTETGGYEGIALWRLGMEDPALWNIIGRRE